MAERELAFLFDAFSGHDNAEPVCKLRGAEQRLLTDLHCKARIAVENNGAFGGLPRLLEECVKGKREHFM